eukprot:5404338-Pleurochrysis_carterae.AAC.1
MHARAHLSGVSRTAKHANAMLHKVHACAALSSTKSGQANGIPTVPTQVHEWVVAFFRAGAAYVQQALEQRHLLPSAHCISGRFVSLPASTDASMWSDAMTAGNK